MAEVLEHEGSTTRRLDRVESDVATLSLSITEVRGDLRNVSAILTRIESTIIQKDQESAETRRAQRPPITAITAILVTIIISLVSVAYAVGSEQARSSAIDEQREIRLKSIEDRSLELDRRIYQRKFEE